MSHAWRHFLNILRTVNVKNVHVLGYHLELPPLSPLHLLYYLYPFLHYIHNFFYIFPIFPYHLPKKYSYQILNPKGIKGMEDPKKASKVLIESTELDADLYRLGNTKACYLPRSYPSNFISHKNTNSRLIFCYCF